VGSHADSRKPVDSVVLLLNADYEPLNVCDLRRAFRLVFGEKAEVIEYDHTEVRTPTEVLRAPSVIRLQYRIKRPRPRVRLSRREVFNRDGHVCVYCGKRTSKLTLDHVVPRHRGGPHSWSNLVAACSSCNHRKGGRLPEEAGMRLKRPPYEPKCDLYSLYSTYLTDPRNEAWRDYLTLNR
jgi:5-methylcytosine-specific restriction endonuclease McrA